MSVFGNLKSDGLEETEDHLGGGFIVETDAIHGKIKAAYAGQSNSSKAMSVNLIVEFPGKPEYRETIWVSNRNNENFFMNKEDKTKKVPLPGYTIINDICLVTTEKPLSDQVTEEKIMNVYDPEAKKELPKAVPMLVELLGKDVVLGIVKDTVFKQKKNDSTGEYEDTTDTRDENHIDKVFHYPSLITVVEATNGKPAEFHDKWVEKNKGVTRDKTKGKTPTGGAQSGRPGGAPQAGGEQKTTSSLFKK